MTGGKLYAVDENAEGNPFGRWKRFVVSRNREEAGFPADEDVELVTYFDAMPQDQAHKHEALMSRCDFFYDRYGDSPLEKMIPEPAAEEAGNGEEEEDRSLYTADKEIRCVFYALVVRNQALEKKYEGGLRGFLKKHGGEYNDEIATICYMSPEFGPDVEDLKKNGLEPRKDFIVLYDDGVNKDYEPFPFEVGWLGGYYHQGGVMVFMVS